MPRRGDELIEFQGRVEASTGKAWKFKSDFMDEAIWVPKSQSEWEPDDDSDEPTGTMKIKEWFVDKNSIE